MATQYIAMKGVYNMRIKRGLNKTYLMAIAKAITLYGQIRPCGADLFDETCFTTQGHETWFWFTFKLPNGMATTSCKKISYLLNN
jgi:hypothetical protein